jgi:hypothetical protein
MAAIVTEYELVVSAVSISICSAVVVTGSPAGSLPLRSCIEYEAIGEPPSDDGSVHSALIFLSADTDTVAGLGVEGDAATGVIGSVSPYDDQVPYRERT